MVGTDYTASVSGAFHLSPASDLLALGTPGRSIHDANGVSADGRVAVGRFSSSADNAAFRYEYGSIGVPYCDAVPNSTGEPGHINATGSRSAASNDVLLIAERLPANAFGFFLTSKTTGDVFPVAGSQGRLCLGGTLGRYVGPGQTQNSGTTGSFQLQIDLTAMPTPTGLVTAVPGDSWRFQAWHRDAFAGAATSNFTDAMTVIFE